MYNATHKYIRTRPLNEDFFLDREKIMAKRLKVVRIHADFFSKCKAAKVHTEMMLDENPDGTAKPQRPHLIVLRLKYKEKKYTFALPIRSNMPKNLPEQVYFQLPQRKSSRTREHRISGIAINKMIPIHKQYFVIYNQDLKDLQFMSFIENNLNDIIEKAQAYLKEYEEGTHYPMSTDIDGIINCLEL